MIKTEFRRLSIALGVLLILSPTISYAQASSSEKRADPLRQWWDEMYSLLNTMGAAHRIVPPTPVKVRWRASLIWNGKVAGQVLDVVAADLGGDSKSELLVLTTTSLLLLSRSRGLFDIRGQVALPNAPAPIRPRDAIGSLSVTTDEGGVAIRLRSSEQAVGALYRYSGGELTYESPRPGYPLCHRGTMYALAGRNTYHGKTATFASGKTYSLAPSLYSVRCSRNEVDPTGHAVEYLSEVDSKGTLRLHCSGDPDFCNAAESEYQGVGVAHLVADVNRDGFPEVITSSSDMSMSGDSIAVYSQKDHGQRLVYDKSFTSGIVAIASGDFDGDGTTEVVAAVRKRGTNRMTLWLLN